MGDEAIIYARAHYVKIFHHFNPNKFSESYKQIDGFDAETHRNTIKTYRRAVDKLVAEDTLTQGLFSSCKQLATFSQQFVDDVYPKALKHESAHNSLSDAFFIEINQIVVFDHKIGRFDSNRTSFKQHVENYKQAVNAYIEKYRDDLPADFLQQRK